MLRKNSLFSAHADCSLRWEGRASRRRRQQLWCPELRRLPQESWCSHCADEHVELHWRPQLGACGAGERSSISEGGGGLKLGKCGVCSRKKIYTRTYREKVYSVSYLFSSLETWKYTFCLLYRAHRTSDEGAKIQCGCELHSLYVSEWGALTLPDQSLSFSFQKLQTCRNSHCSVDKCAHLQVPQHQHLSNQIAL